MGKAAEEPAAAGWTQVRVRVRVNVGEAALVERGWEWTREKKPAVLLGEPETLLLVHPGSVGVVDVA